MPRRSLAGRYFRGLFERGRHSADRPANSGGRVHRHSWLISALIALLACAMTVQADDSPDVDLDAILPVATSGHLDQFFRKRGFESYQDGSYEWARRYFEFAAAYGDKISQFALATLHRNGEGVPRDAALAYAWLDLAAERGYPEFLAQREAVWNSLDAAQRERAVMITTELYARYGDRVAKRRHAQQIRRYLRRSLVSHPSIKGHIVSVDKHCRGAVRGIDLLEGFGCRDDDFSADRFDPKAYWVAQDEPWLPQGKVDVGPLQRSGR